jgi:hypothetical protein
LHGIDWQHGPFPILSFNAVRLVCDYQRCEFQLAEKKANAARDDVGIEIPDEDPDDGITNLAAAHG